MQPATSWLALCVSSVVACGEVHFVGLDADHPDAAVLVDAAVAADADVRCDLRAPFDPPAPLVGLSRSDMLEIAPRLSIDERSVYFHGRATAETGSDLWVADRVDRRSAFGQPRRLAISDATAVDYEPALSADGRTLVFASSRVSGNVALFAATRDDVSDEFTSPMPLGGLDSASGFLDSSPSFSLDGRELWFASNRGHWSQWDLYRVRLTATGPVDVQPAAVNSAGTEVAAAPSIDNAALYFVANRPGVTAGNDVWVAYRAADGTLEEPHPVGGINSAGAEDGGWLSPDGCRYYFSSDRDGTHDLFVAERRR